MDIDFKTSHDVQETADQRCQEANEGDRLLALESKEEQTFVANAFRPLSKLHLVNHKQFKNNAMLDQVAPFLFTAGRLEDGHFHWFTSDSNEQIDVGFPEWVDDSCHDPWLVR